MLRAMLRDLRAHLGRVLMTLLAIVLGVGFVVATWVVSDSAAATVGDTSTRADLAAVAQPRGSDDLTAASVVTAEQVARLATLPGVSRADGIRGGYAGLVTVAGKLGTASWPELGGTDWDGSDRFALLDGRGPQRAGEVALEERAAVEAGLSVGDQAKVLLAGGRADTATVVGVFAFRTAGTEIVPAVAYDQDTAGLLLRRVNAATDGDPGYVRVELFGADEHAVAAAARAALGPGFIVKPGAELQAEQAAMAADNADVIRKFLLAFAAVALLAGAFVIANTFTMLVTQRTRHFALLRAVGARRVQVRRAVLAEAAVLGLVGGTAGVALGVGLGLLAMRVLRTTGETVVYAVSPWAVLLGYAVALVVTTVAAYGSARRAAAVAPVAALRTDAALPRRSLVLRTVLGALAVAAGVTMVVATSGSSLTESQRAVGMGGALLAWLGVLLFAPLLAMAVLRPLARLLRSRGAVTRIALRNAIRDPRRTAATASALMIGLALVSAFATVGETFGDDMTASVRASVPERAVVLRPATYGQLDDAARATAAAVPGTTAIAAPLSGEVRVSAGSATAGSGGDGSGGGAGGEGRSVVFTGVDPAAFGSALRADLTDGTADLRRGVVLPVGFAADQGLAVGGPVRLSFTTAGEGGAERVVAVASTVVGLHRESDLVRGVLVDQSLVPAGVPLIGDAVFAVGGDPVALRAALERAFADRPDVLVMDRERLLATYLEPFQLVLGLLYVLLGAAVVIAVFGVVNTLALSVLERTRELGVFRALGASRKLVRRTVRRESVVITLYGGLLGIGVGLLLGGVMQHVIFATPVLSFSVPWTTAGIALAGMVLVGVLAAVWPARRAARADILAAIATE